MLKSIDPILTPDLLWLLASMGHGDDLVVVDANHPATAHRRAPSSQRLIQLPGMTHGDGRPRHHRRSIRSTISIPTRCA